MNKTLKDESPRGDIPSGLSDPLAGKISWQPLINGGSGGRNCKLVKVGHAKVEFRSTIAFILLPTMLLLAGLLVIWGGVRSSVSDGIGPLILGVLSLCVGGIYLYFQTNRSVFDKQSGVFTKTKRSINASGNLERAPQRGALNDIHALQLLVKNVRSRGSSGFKCYELNLVFDNAGRINVANHGNLEWIRQDAATLAVFLGKPIWDEIG
jgi:hypothetical protein